MLANILTLENVSSYACDGKFLKYLHPDTFNSKLTLNINLYRLYLSNNLIATLHNTQFKDLIKLKLIFFY